jgi:hypothetical protein
VVVAAIGTIIWIVIIVVAVLVLVGLFTRRRGVR